MTRSAYARAMLDANKDSGSMVVDIRNPVVASGVLTLQHMGWHELETYI